LLRARCILRRVRESKDKIAGRLLFVNHEYGGWRLNLADFVGMAPYFRPEYLPVRPARPPAPDTRNCAGPRMRSGRFFERVAAPPRREHQRKYAGNSR
jgi:hypothetical protein